MSDTDYLKETVGDALALGVAATITASPSDPVEYLAVWLRKYVENQRTLVHLENEREAREQRAVDERAEQVLRWKESEAQMKEREGALRELLNYNAEDSWALWQKAMDTIVRFTSVSAAYIANVSQPEEAEPTLPDEAEGGEPGPTEEQDYAPYVEPEAVPPPEVPAEGEAPAAETSEAAPAEGEPNPDAPPAENPEGEAAPPQKVFDYTQKFLEFVIQNAERSVPDSARTLRRPPPVPEGEEPPNPLPPVPLLFSVLDQNLKGLYYPDVLLAPNFSFPGDFPRPGAFEAQAIITGEKEIKAVLCADTLVPEGSGLALSQHDRDFITRVADALEANLSAAQDRFSETQKANAEALKEKRRALQAALEEAIRPPEPSTQAVEGEEGAAPAPEASAAPAAEGSSAEGAPAEGEEEVPPEVPPEEEAAPAEGEAAPPAEEGEEGEPKEPPPRDPAKELEKAEKKHERGVKVVARANWEAKQAAKAAAAAEAEHATQEKLLEVVRSYFGEVAADAKDDLGAYTSSPALTFRLLRAALVVLKSSVAPTWTTVRALIIGGTMLEEFRQATPDDYLAVSEADRRRLRALLRGLNTPEAVATMDAECPRSALGFFIQRLMGQLRVSALALAAMRAAQDAKAKADQKAADSVKAQEELTAAIEQLKVEVAEAEEKARIAAEEAAAAAAAAGEAAPEGEAPAEGEAAPEGEEE